MPVTVRVPATLLERIDADVAARGKASRSAWLLDLAAAVLDGRLVMAPGQRTITASAASTRPRREYSKADQASGRGNRTG